MHKLTSPKLTFPKLSWTLTIEKPRILRFNTYHKHTEIKKMNKENAI